MTSVAIHTITVESKRGESAELYRWSCSCGEAGSAWYRGPLTAARVGGDHIDKVA